ncbi:MAG: hypothetical protein M3024_01525 [Candidatus Dormibacteraeota bacterium]|nr:hypothetical protein [Candidatus Dormibacteraeota bacterium]
MDRRGRIGAGLAIGALLLAVALTAWLSTRGVQPSAPVYGNGGSAAAGLWTWDGSAYRLLPIADPGPYSNDADMAYDRARGLTVLWDHGCGRLVMGFTGGCTAQVDQTWTWDGRAWTRQAARSSPQEMGRGVMVYDPRLASVLYVNGVGRAWAWNGSDWRAVELRGAPGVPSPGAASAPSTFAVGYDEGRNVLVFVLSDSTWLWDGGTWTSVPGGIRPADSRSDPHLVYDSARRLLVYVGSRLTWTWDGARWQAHDQPTLGSATLAYDPIRGQTTLLEEDTSACDRTACRTATWTFDAASWTRRQMDKVVMLPLTRSGASAPPLAFDERRGVLILFASAT